MYAVLPINLPDSLVVIAVVYRGSPDPMLLMALTVITYSEDGTKNRNHKRNMMNLDLSLSLSLSTYTGSLWYTPGYPAPGFWGTCLGCLSPTLGRSPSPQSSWRGRGWTRRRGWTWRGGWPSDSWGVLVPQILSTENQHHTKFKYVVDFTVIYIRIGIHIIENFLCEFWLIYLWTCSLPELRSTYRPGRPRRWWPWV